MNLQNKIRINKITYIIIYLFTCIAHLNPTLLAKQRYKFEIMKSFRFNFGRRYLSDSQHLLHFAVANRNYQLTSDSQLVYQTVRNIWGPQLQ